MSACFQSFRAQVQKIFWKEHYALSYFPKKGHCPVCVTISSRCCSSTAQKKDSKELVYIGTLASQIRGIKIFSLLTSGMGICGQPILIEQASKLGSKPLIVAVCGILGIFTFVTPVLLHLITRKYVTEIWYDESTGKYTATTLTFFMREKDLEFTPGDVEIPDIMGIFSSFIVKGVPLFVEPTTFKKTSHYGKIMGFDKPIDFKLGVQSDDSAKK